MFLAREAPPHRRYPTKLLRFMKPSEDPVHTGVPLSLSYNTFSARVNLASEMYAQNTSIQTDADVERRYVQQPDWLIVCRRNTLVEFANSLWNGHANTRPVQKLTFGANM